MPGGDSEIFSDGVSPDGSFSPLMRFVSAPDIPPDLGTGDGNPRDELSPLRTRAEFSVRAIDELTPLRSGDASSARSACPEGPIPKVVPVRTEVLRQGWPLCAHVQNLGACDVGAKLTFLLHTRACILQPTDTRLRAEGGLPKSIHE